ncbi:unnamed protein product [Auanema sp. JU1783]|nr:unnamed protein product [Auanema sp. JU1783]
MRTLFICLFVVGSVFALNGKGLNNDVVALLGVPYAKPPVDTLRFRESVPVEFDKEKSYKVWRNRCIDFRVEEGLSEDCLYLNMFVKKENFLKGKKTKLLLHITNEEVSETKISSLVTADLSVAVASARDGVLGSLNDAPYSVSDVKAILNFLYDTDEFLVGDVTIWAENTLAETVASALPQITVKASIQINGNGVTRTRYREDYGKRAMHDLRTLSACDLPAEEQSLDCLRTKSLNDLLDHAHELWVSYRPLGSPFRSPRTFIPENSVPTIYGIHKHIGKEYLYEPRDFTEQFDYNIFKEFLANLIPDSLFKNAPLVRRMILHQYVYSTGDKKDTYHLFQQMEKILFDKDYHIPTEMLIRHLREYKNKVWLMEYGVDTPLKSCVQDGTPDTLDAFCKRLLQFFTRFAEKDAPTEYSCDPKNPNFPQMDTSKRPYYIILPESGIADWRYNYYLPEYELWMHMVPMLDQLDLVGFRPPQFEEAKQTEPLQVEDDVQGWHQEEAKKGEKLHQEKVEL